MQWELTATCVPWPNDKTNEYVNHLDACILHTSALIQRIWIRDGSVCTWTENTKVINCQEKVLRS